MNLGIGFVPQSNNVFPSLTIKENLEMGCYQAPKKFTERFDFVSDLFPALGERQANVQGSSPAASARWWPWAGRS